MTNRNVIRVIASVLVVLVMEIMHFVEVEMECFINWI